MVGKPLKWRRPQTWRTRRPSSRVHTGIPLCTNMGEGFYGCSGGANGGTPPYTFSWTSNAYATIDHVAIGPTNTRIEGSCTRSTIGSPNQVTLTVRDSVGATASAQRNFKCTPLVP
ncbi:hypothetical protein MEBOL_003173 [Melittangium boletus DSM 14713]|uniref:Ig-like domain-containing protein n=1 Tax=Melittangium boletus DSM 14713 TaxID=1294270 RepID=A0A250IEP3_9BACT|nr:hypothetical protein MEBOL_003173 [Melittangium boletus DSM 14713]